MMKKPLKTLASKPLPKATRAAKVGQYLGTTKDGVKIMRPLKAPTNFTVKEIRDAVAHALNKNAQA